MHICAAFQRQAGFYAVLHLCPIPESSFCTSE